MARASGSGDCTILNAVWGYLWNPKSQFYLPNVARNGLHLPAFGINIDPFDTVSIGDLPEITMFDEPVLGYMKIALTSNSLSGIASINGSQFHCDDSSPTATKFGFNLTFQLLDLKGDYTVSAGGGIGGCAIAAAAGILGGRAMAAEGAFMAADPVAKNIDLSLWYQGPLGESDNGLTLLGAYDTHEDPIYDLQQNPAYQQAALRADASRVTSDRVSAATGYYRDHQTGRSRTAGARAAEDAPPTIGTPSDYQAGVLPYSYLLALANQKIINHEDPDGRYAALYNSMVHFYGSVTWVQKYHSGERPVGGDEGILAIIAKAPAQEVHDFVMANGPYEILNPLTEEMMTVEPVPLDYSAFKAAGIARRRRLEAEDSTASASSSVDGTYDDAISGLSANVSATLTMVSGKLTVSIDAIQAVIPSLHVTLSQSAGWWPGLYDKVTNWIANDTTLNGSIKTKLQDAIGGPDMRNRLAAILNGALSSM